MTENVARAHTVVSGVYAWPDDASTADLTVHIPVSYPSEMVTIRIAGVDELFSARNNQVTTSGWATHFDKLAFRVAFKGSGSELLQLMQSVAHWQSEQTTALNHMRWIFRRSAGDKQVIQKEGNSPKLKLIRSIHAMAALGPNWAGENSKPPSGAMRKLARDVIEALDSDLLPDSVSASADGDIGLFWRRAKGGVDLFIDQDGYLVWLLKAHNEVTPGGEFKFEGALTADFAEALRSIF